MNRRTIGLALSGGGARGFAHLGVLRALVEHGVPIDFVAGTSAGAFVGGAFAAGMAPAEIEDIGRDLSWFKIAGLSYSPRGILSNSKITRFVEKRFSNRTFADLKIPFAAVACDLESGAEVIIRDSMDLATAIRASCAIPGVFVPVNDANGRMLIDGGVVSPVPMNAIRAFSPDIVIAVDLMACGARFWGTPRTLLGTLFQSAMVLLRSASRFQHYAADVVIAPEIAHIRPDQISKRDELIRLGEDAALKKMDEIERLLES